LAETANDERRTTGDDFDLLCAPRERQQRDIARPFDRPRQTALMRRAHTGQAARRNLSALRDELRQQAHIFVINRLDLLDAKLTYFLAPEKLAAAFARTAWPSAWPRTARSSAITASALRTTF
jgi:hypothetical protein